MPITNPRRVTLATTALLTGLLACSVSSDSVDRHDAALAGDSGDRGAFLYHRLCAGCHGLRGGGDALPQRTMAPAPRDFGAGLFKLVSTNNGIPTDADLSKSIGRGLPGTAMPGFAWLGSTDLDHLARYVRQLAVDGFAERLIRDAEVTGEMTEAEAVEHATAVLTPGKPVAVPTEVVAAPAVLARGKQIFLARCAACHGEQGTGQRPIAAWAGHMTVHWARDFRAGVFRGSVATADLARRIQAGMPASAMPPNSFADPDDLSALIAYTQSLLPKDAEDRLVQRRQTILVAKGEAAPRSIEDAAWQGVDPTRVVMSPFAWQEDSIVGCEVRAMHDGEQLSVLVSWQDKTNDARGVPETGFADALAIEFSAAEVPVFFGMGSRRHPVQIWHWKPAATKNSAGVLDINSGLPGGRRADVVVGQTSGARPAVALMAHGRRSAQGFSSQDRSIAAVSRWRDGRWTVLLRRQLKSVDGDQVEFRRGSTLRMALAIWDGSTARRRTDKSFSIWHQLRLE